MSAVAAAPPPGLATTVRIAGLADNAALLELTLACPMEGRLSLAIEHGDDFFALARARGDGQTYVADSGGSIVACASVCRRPAWLAGMPGEMGYVSDVKVAPSARGQGLSQRLLAAVAHDEAAREPAPLVGSVTAGNLATDGMLRRFGVRAPVQRLSNFVAWQLVPFPSTRRPRGVTILRAEPRDEAELAAFLDGYHASRAFAPVFGDGGLRDILARSPGMALSSYRIVRHAGRIVAAAAAWDASSLKQTRIRQLTPGLRWLTTAMRGARRMLPVPRFFAEGELLRLLYIRHAAHTGDGMGALRAIVRDIVVDAAEAEMHFAMFTHALNDPVAACVTGMPKLAYRYGLVAGSNTAAYAPQLAALAGTIQFDDPALS